MIVGSIKENTSLEKESFFNSRLSKKYYWTWVKSVYRKRICAYSFGIDDNEYSDIGVEIKIIIKRSVKLK